MSSLTPWKGGKNGFVGEPRQDFMMFAIMVSGRVRRPRFTAPARLNEDPRSSAATIANL